MGSVEDVAGEFDRARALERLAQESFDVVVIGGGVTGCGVALDAAARGLRTALVERHDFATGTSSRSSKLVHGGLRYLQQREFRLVYEALAERQRLIENAPHLVHPLPFLIPLFGRDGVVSAGVAKAYSTALWLYDVTGGLRIGHRHRRISAAEALDHFPVLRTDRLVASFLYWDAQTDDARLTLALARTAAAHGAAVVNYAPVAALTHDQSGARITGVRLAAGTEVRARAVVNATGVWAEEVGHLDSGSPPVAIRPAKGIHVTVPAHRLPCDYASVLAVPGDRRTVFVVPWDASSGSPEYTYLGTTDTDYDGPLDDPECTMEDVAYVLRAVNAWTDANLTPDDVTGTWAGLRPLVAGEPGGRAARRLGRPERGDRAPTADLSRRHRVLRSPSGLITVTGGKLTTYRRMAADTVDAVYRALGTRPVRCPTRHLRLIGAPARGQTDTAVARHLWARYGTEARAVLALADDDPSLLEPLSDDLPYLRAEVVFAARHEMARTVTDVLARRLRALMLDRDAAVAAAPEAARLLGRELGWTADTGAAEVARFVALADEEREALGPERPGAAGARSGVPGPERPGARSGVPGPERPGARSGVPGPERPGAAGAASGMTGSAVSPA